MKRRDFCKKLSAGAAVFASIPIIGGSALGEERNNDDSGDAARPFTFDSNAECYRPCGRGVYDRLTDRTYIVYLNDGHRPFIKAYDHGNRKWSDAVRISSSTGSSSQPDHLYPSLWVDAEGHLRVVYGAHGGRYSYSVSQKPHDISAWESRPSIGTRHCYPQPIASSGGREVYLFSTRYGPRRLVYYKSDDGGDTFSDRRLVVGPAPHGRGVYIGTIKHQPQTASEPEKFHIPWTHHRGGMGRDEQQYPVHYCCFNAEDGHVYNAGGEDMGENVEYPEGWEACHVSDPWLDRKEMQFIPNVGVTKAGAPFVIWMEREAPATVSGKMYTYFSIYESEKNDWTTRRIHEEDDTESRCTDVDVAGDGTITLYYPSGDAMDMLVSKDDGKTWEKKNIYSPSASGVEALYFAGMIDSAHMEPFAARHPDFQLTFKQFRRRNRGGKHAQFAWGQGGMLSP